MYGARIMEVGESTSLFTGPRHPYTDGLLRSIPRRGQPLTPIAGTIFDLRSPPDGCRFHPRCPYAEDRCRRETPELRALEPAGDGRLAACHFPLAGAGAKA
ncbi:MAG: hypothetical protein IH869_01715 [Chloroflexi bacterium]|nr:hypothetical protein [Chloroflexota bacterium]